MKEEVFRYGENNRGFGMVTLPDDPTSAPVMIAFNAGLLHREGPYRLNVLVCRALAKVGYIAIRIDLSGKGDTPSRERLTNRHSVALDWQFIKQAVVERFGPRNLVLFGLCSGADNAIKITAEESDVCGLVLLDPVSQSDSGFRRRQLVSKITNVHKWINLPKTLLTKVRRRLGIEKDKFSEMWSLRGAPSPNDMQSCFRHIARRQGKVLAVFTSQTLEHYNQQGQFVRALEIPKLEECCEEVFWPLMDHLFCIQTHRDISLGKVTSWAEINFKYFCQEKPH
jgi:Serine aminopeptidase, S33